METSWMARTMLASATRMALSAISGRGRPKCPAMSSNTRCEACSSIDIAPPRKASGRIVPWMMCASVMVGRSPPRP